MGETGKRSRSQEVFLREAMGPGEEVGRLIDDVNRVAESDFTVIILGETGSGKELVARAIHSASPRTNAPFVPVDCGAIPESLLESELFGHERGAFTGAEMQRAGKFELAQSGTLFLDEITNMPMGSQAKLLRVLQEKVLYRIGGGLPVTVNVRLLVASNQDPQEAVEAGSFRRDLFYRLNEFTISIPPLRGRRGDILYLADRFLRITNGELNKNVRGFSPAATSLLLNYHWPGNVRQLRSTIRRAVLLAKEEIEERHLDVGSGKAMGQFKPEPGFVLEDFNIPAGDFSLKEFVRRSITTVERQLLERALKQTGGNKAEAARLLKIDYKTIHTKLKRLGIN